MDLFHIQVSQADISKEKQKARELRKSRWWKDKLAQLRCEYCEGKFPADELTMDHIVPVVRGGKTVKSNIAVACKECNSRKKYLLPMEWDDYMKSKKG